MGGGWGEVKGGFLGERRKRREGKQSLICKPQLIHFLWGHIRVVFHQFFDGYDVKSFLDPPPDGVSNHGNASQNELSNVISKEGRRPPLIRKTSI